MKSCRAQSVRKTQTNRQKENVISHSGKAEFSDNKTLLVGRCCLNPFYLLLHILKMSPGVPWLVRVA